MILGGNLLDEITNIEKVEDIRCAECLALIWGEDDGAMCINNKHVICARCRNEQILSGMCGACTYGDRDDELKSSFGQDSSFSNEKNSSCDNGIGGCDFKSYVTKKSEPEIIYE